MAEQGINLAQMEALLTPLKEAVEANTARLTSMESKLGDYDASLEDLSRRFSVLEDAPAQSVIEEEVKLEVDSQMRLCTALLIRIWMT